MLSAIIISPDEKFWDNARKLLEGSNLIEVRTELNSFKVLHSIVGDLTKSRIWNCHHYRRCHSC